MRITRLEARQTMAAVRRRRQLDDDCREVANLITRHPGIPSKRAIAIALDMKHQRVAECLRHINANETPYSRFDYGRNTAKDGRYAGRTQRGWWPMRYARHQPVMDQADEHSSLVEHGVRASRMRRLAFAKGLDTQAAARVVISLERRLGVDIEFMSTSDLDAFEVLLEEELETNGAE